MPEPLVSIVISSFDCAKFLTTAIESALAQTYRHIEIVVVDDGSNDESPAMIRKFGSRTRPIFQTRAGAAAACNAGFAESSGSIILFLDANDMLFPAAVRQIIEAWTEGTIKVQYKLELIDDQGKSKGTAFPCYPRNYTPEALHRDFQATGHYPWPTASGNAYDRGFLAKILPLPAEAFHSAPEGAINIVAPLFGKIISLPRPLACYRTPGSHQRALSHAMVSRFANFIQQKEREVAFLRRTAECMGVELPIGNLLDYSQDYVESILCARKLALLDPSVQLNSLPRLCTLALHNLIKGRASIMRGLSSLIFCIFLACSKGKFALWLIASRYDPASHRKIALDLLKSLKPQSRRFST
jgi:glycosyltransferase involved in cell wall biosynthesis